MRRPKADAPPPTATPAPGPAAYLYGIVRWPAPWPGAPKEPAASLGAGVGDPAEQVLPVVHRDLAALVTRLHPGAVGSAHDVRALRRDMRAHANVLNRVVALGGTVLPAAFGLMFPGGDRLEEQFLRPRYRTLDAHLTRLDDAVEVTLKATYVEDQALEEVVATTPQLAQATARRAASLDAKIELGRRVAQALAAKRDREALQVLEALKPTAREVKLIDPGAELVVLNASFLVPRKALPKFDKALEEVSRAARGRMTFDCVGPLPPYSFVDLRL